LRLFHGGKPCDDLLVDVVVQLETEHGDSVEVKIRAVDLFRSKRSSIKLFEIRCEFMIEFRIFTGALRSVSFATCDSFFRLFLHGQKRGIKGDCYSSFAAFPDAIKEPRVSVLSYVPTELQLQSNVHKWILNVHPGFGCIPPDLVTLALVNEKGEEHPKSSPRPFALSSENLENLEYTCADDNIDLKKWKFQ
jgi:hypothetical protein